MIHTRATAHTRVHVLCWTHRLTRSSALLSPLWPLFENNIRHQIASLCDVHANHIADLCPHLPHAWAYANSLFRHIIMFANSYSSSIRANHLYQVCGRSMRGEIRLLFFSPESLNCTNARTRLFVACAGTECMRPVCEVFFYTHTPNGRVSKCTRYAPTYIQ